MQMVITIDDGIYQDIVDGKGEVPRTIVRSFQATIADAIKNGTPLPNGLENLIDGDKVLDDIEKQYPASASETDKCKKYARLVYYWAVKNAPTIIFADEEVQDEDR